MLRRHGRFGSWILNGLTSLCVLGILAVPAVTGLIFFNPHTALNPLPPPEGHPLPLSLSSSTSSFVGPADSPGGELVREANTPPSDPLASLLSIPSATHIPGPPQGVPSPGPGPDDPQPATPGPQPTGSPLSPGSTPPAPNSPTSSALPECPSHDPTRYHALVDAERGCHYDHEHGKHPQGSALFSFLMQITGGQEISYVWQTPDENLIKHGGYKYDWRDGVACAGREGSPLGVSSYLILRHGMGHYAMAMAGPLHSFSAAVTICDVATGQDVGTIVTAGWQSFGQRTSPYQGEILPFDHSKEYAMLGDYSAYDSAREPYFSIDCVGSDCHRDLGNVTGNSTWISEPGNLFGNRLLAFLFRVRDAHSVVDGDTRFGTLQDLRFLFVCSDDGGLTFRPAGCDNNNSTGAIHEIVGTIPEEWDDLDAVLDGFVTYQGFTDRWGRLVEGCSSAGLDCVPLILQNVPVGRYGMQDSGVNSNPFDEESLPEYDIYFCGEQVCTESDPGAVPSGWIGPEN